MGSGGCFFNLASIRDQQPRFCFLSPPLLAGANDNPRRARYIVWVQKVARNCLVTLSSEKQQILATEFSKDAQTCEQKRMLKALKRRATSNCVWVRRSHLGLILAKMLVILDR